MERKQPADGRSGAGSGDFATLRREQQTFGSRLERVGRASQEGRQAGVFFFPQETVLPGAALFFHGGGYVSGEGDFAWGAASVLATRLGLPVCCASYRLAPEFPYPAALEDALTAYQALDLPPEQVVVIGDSAGGGLALALLQQLSTRGMPMPAGLIALSPWADLTMERLPPEGDDGFLSVSAAREWAALYADGQDLHAPGVSPLYGNFIGFPPVELFAGGAELLLEDIRLLRDRLEAAGGSVELHVAPGLWHDYLFTGMRGAREDYQRMRQFLNRVLNGPSPPPPQA